MSDPTNNQYSFLTPDAKRYPETEFKMQGRPMASISPQEFAELISQDDPSAPRPSAEAIRLHMDHVTLTGAAQIIREALNTNTILNPFVDDETAKIQAKVKIEILLSAVIMLAEKNNVGIRVEPVANTPLAMANFHLGYSVWTRGDR